MKRVCMLNLQGEFKLFADEVREAVCSVLESGRYIGGPEVGQLEAALCNRFGVGHGVAISSGTDALLCSLMALEISVGDEVILPSFTFFATAGTVARLCAIPVFVDIDPKTFTIDPSLLEAVITDKTRAIIAVHLFGQSAEMDAINEIANRFDVPVIEDAAQAIGAKYHDRFAGTLGSIACFSFYPTKNLGGFGEGGMILTHNDRLATIARQLRNHGESERYVHDRVGGNFRLDTMKAAILLVKLRFLEQFTKRRREIAAMYNKWLADSSVVTPCVHDGQYHVYHQYSILCDRREALMTYLRAHGIDSGVYYPIGLHQQKCFSSLGYKKGSLPITEQTCDRILALPCHPMMNDEEVEHVAKNILSFYSDDSAEPIIIPSSETAAMDHG